jgi:hypothetical protein
MTATEDSTERKEKAQREQEEDYTHTHTYTLSHVRHFEYHPPASFFLSPLYAFPHYRMMRSPVASRS